MIEKINPVINSVPAVSEDGLTLFEMLKDDLRKLKEAAYGAGCNVYKEEHYTISERLPRNMTKEDLEEKLDNIFSAVKNLQLATESTETRTTLEEGLGRKVESVIPLWFPKNALVMYSLRAEGRLKDGMQSPISKKNPNWGFKQKTTPVAVFHVDEWPSAWRDFVFTDRRIMEEDMSQYMPKGADYLLSTVHKFEVVVEKDANGRTLEKRYAHVPNSESLHWRVKSGPEKLWKMVSLLTGMQDKEGKTKEHLLDEAGLRLLCEPKYLGPKFVKACQTLVGDHTWWHKLDESRDYENIMPLKLQKLPVNDKSYNHRNEFLKSIPKKYRVFCNRILSEENRPLKISDDTILPYYIEMLTRLGKNDSRVVDKNVINTLIYANSTFDAMYEEKGYDTFAYKVRSEGWRADHYTLFEWSVAKKLAPLIMPGDFLDYVNDVVDVRMQQAGLSLTL